MYPNGTVPTGPGMLHGGGCHQYHLGDTMNGKASILLSGLVAILMVTCAVPFMASEDSDALIGNATGMSLNTNSAVLYENNGTSSIQLSITQYISGDNPNTANWYLHDIDDGTDFVELSTPTTGSSITVSVTELDYGVEVASVEVVASIDVVDGNDQPVIDPNTNEQVKHTASAVIVVYPSPSTSATTFHYYFKIDSNAYDYLVNNSVITGATLPNGYTMSQFNTGFWIAVTQEDTGLSDANFNALSALQWYLNYYGWSNNFSNYGWIQDLLGLDSYPGDGGVWYYWAQYHLTNDGWEFNNTTLQYITDVDSAYIGLIFWGSPDADTMPTPVPDFPA